jgi:hypothetical protein
MNPTAAEYSGIYCLGCYYDLRGLSSDRCPECGRPFDPALPSTFSRQAKPTPMRDIVQRIANTLDQLSETGDAEEQLRRLRRRNPFFNEIFRLQQANEVLRLEVQRLKNKLVAHNLISPQDVESIDMLIDDSIVDFEFVENDEDAAGEEAETPPSADLLAIERAAAGKVLEEPGNPKPDANQDDALTA